MTDDVNLNDITEPEDKGSADDAVNVPAATDELPDPDGEENEDA
jgi:hypothetical protein